MPASSGAEALNVLEENPVDLVITDINMPAMTGVELLGRIRSQMPRQRVIAFTANALPEDIANYLDDGFDEVLTKPLSLPHLAGALVALEVAAPQNSKEA